jgi:hypothetical protein
MGDVATLLFVHFNFIIQLRNMFLFLKTIHIAYQVKCNRLICQRLYYGGGLKKIAPSGGRREMFWGIS